MPPLPARPNIDHLKKQAKELLRLYRNRDARACGRVSASPTCGQDKDDAAIVALDLAARRAIVYRSRIRTPVLAESEELRGLAQQQVFAGPKGCGAALAA